MVNGRTLGSITLDDLIDEDGEEEERIIYI